MKEFTQEKSAGNNSPVNQMPENKIGVMPVNKLLFSMAIPMIFSMLVQAGYNIVDSIFVANLSQDALTAVSLAFPLQNIMVSLAIGTGVGVNALLSKSLGERNQRIVNLAAVNGIFLAFCSALVCMLASRFILRPFFSSQTEIATIVDYGCEYTSICMFFCLPLFGQIIFERLLLSTGKTIYSMITQTTGAVLNIILDSILIFGVGPIPALGMTGCGMATVISQFCAMLLAIIINFKINTEIQFSALRGFRPNWMVIKRIYAVALPSIILTSIVSVMCFGLNKILLLFTESAVTVFGIYQKLQSFVFMPVFGLNSGMVPIIAYNYGAHKPDRIIQTIKISIASAVSIMLVGFTVFHVFPEELLLVFKANEELMQIGIPALQTISYSFLVAGFGIILSSVFQAMEHGLFSMIISLCRQLVILLPTAYLLAQTGNLNNVWYAFPIAEVGAVIMCSIALRKIYKDKIKPLYNTQS